MCVCFIIALPTTSPPPTIQSPLNPSGRTDTGSGSNSGAIAGGVIVVIIALAAVGATAIIILIFM